MDPHRFTDENPGDLRKFRNFQTGKEEWQFLPHELPPKWEFPAKLWPLLADAREALGTLNGIGQTLPSPELLLRPLQTREAITSSSIEGTYVTPQQLLLYELDPTNPQDPHEKSADWREVLNYSQALQQGCQLLQQYPIATRLILAMHATLMSGVRGQDKSPGRYRQIQVQIGATGKYVPPPHSEIDQLMGNLEKFINSGANHFDPLVKCYLVHYQFEAIHPFVDGNGRVGRALLALMVYHVMGHSMPWLYMSAFFERHKEEYTDNLFRISTHGDWERWIEFCLTGTVVQAKDAITRCNLFKRTREIYHAKLVAPTPRSHKIIDNLFTSPLLTVSSLMKHFSITYHTARKDLENLVEAGILLELPGMYPRTFYAPELMRIAFEESPYVLSESENVQ
jgi:Fic family protein